MKVFEIIIWTIVGLVFYIALAITFKDIITDPPTCEYSEQAQLVVLRHNDGSFALITKDRAFDHLTEFEVDSMLFQLSTDTVQTYDKLTVEWIE